MASNHDVREWARNSGYEIADSGPLPTDIKRAYEAYEAGTEPESVLRYSTETGDPDVMEIAPVIKVTMADRVRETKERIKPPARTRRKAAVKKPAKPRVSIERAVSFGWGFFGAVVSRLSPGVGYMMETQAPVAGMIMEDSLKGTIVDKVMQPLARGRDMGVVLGALCGPPMFTLALQARPDKANLIVPALRESLMMWMEVAGDKVEEVREKNEEYENKYGQSVNKIINGMCKAMGAEPIYDIESDDWEATAPR
jgi:hypothetical protein